MTFSLRSFASYPVFSATFFHVKHRCIRQEFLDDVFVYLYSGYALEMLHHRWESCLVAIDSSVREPCIPFLPKTHVEDLELKVLVTSFSLPELHVYLVC